ncbi:MAG: hypothetical protein Q7U94_06095 [Sideroxyarcus sp.]|nr:hypothetical protein [Sideroxyarcus sp.]
MMLRIALLVLFLAGCNSAKLVQVPKDDQQSYEKYSLPVVASSTEAVVYIVHLQDGQIVPKKAPEYRWVRNVQIGDSKVLSSAPGEHSIFKIKPGSHKIKVTGICGRADSTVMPPKGSDISPDMPGWTIQTTYFGNVFMGTPDDVLFEPGKTYIYSMSPTCYLNRHSGDLVFLLGMRLRDDPNANYLVYKTKSVGN